MRVGDVVVATVTFYALWIALAEAGELVAKSARSDGVGTISSSHACRRVLSGLILRASSRV